MEEIQTKAVLRLMKAILLIETIAANEAISKERLVSNEIKHYKINKLERIRYEFKSVNVTLIEDEYDLERYTYTKKSKEKVPKKSTVQETYELWQQKLSIKEIAERRVLTK